MYPLYVDIGGKEYLVKVTYWEKYTPAKTTGDPYDCYPEEGGQGEWIFIDPVTDEEAYPSMTHQDELKVAFAVFEYMENNQDYEPYESNEDYL